MVLYPAPAGYKYELESFSTHSLLGTNALFHNCTQHLLGIVDLIGI